MPTPEVYQVSELVSGIARTLAADFDEVVVEGEISNLRRPSSGHSYFTLKDERAQLRSVMWRSTRTAFEPMDGQLVRAVGSLTMYAPRGDLQLVVRQLRLAGEGALQRAFEELKRKLQAEGLFDPARKRPLPPFPLRIGVVTSGTGAAFQDIARVIGRRFPLATLLLASVRVQGLEAAPEITRAIRAFNDVGAGDANRPDVLIVGRGGGSLEDLWPFNEEIVARAVHASGIPVVSAVGHETDITICDLVADVRAATPSMAAELVVPDANDLIASLAANVRRLRRAVAGMIDRSSERVQQRRHRLQIHSPRRRIDTGAQRVDDLQGRMDRAVGQVALRTSRRASSLADRLRALDPGRPLRAGYALIRRKGTLVRRAGDLEIGDALEARFTDGFAGLKVLSRAADDARDGPRARET